MKKEIQIGFRTTKEIKDKLEKDGEKKDRTISYMINTILSDHYKIK